MKLTYTPLGGGAVALHDLGEISMMEQQSAHEPPDLPVREIKRLLLKCQFFADGYAANYQLVQQVQAAFTSNGGQLKWQDEDTGDENGQALEEGEVFLDQPAVLEAHNFPSDPNAIGTFHQ